MLHTYIVKTTYGNTKCGCLAFYNSSYTLYIVHNNNGERDMYILKREERKSFDLYLYCSFTVRLPFL